VSLRCAGGWPWRALRVLLPALAATALAAWVLGHAGWPLAPAALIGLLVGAVAWRRTAPVPVALSWDGRCWRADGVEGRLDLKMDLGPWLLLRLRPQGRARWVAVSAAEAGAAMHALRAAVYCRAPETTPGVSPAVMAGPSQPD
jgi:hypothetical protein